MQQLKKISFFGDIDSSQLEPFNSRCHWKRFEDGQIVVDFEDRNTDVYFIVDGKVRVLIRTLSGTEIILADLLPGQMFGELAAIDGIERSANVSALGRSEICIMPSSVFRELLLSSPAVCFVVLRLLSGRVRELNARLTEHTVFDIKHRLYAELLRLSTKRSGREDERILSPPPFHHVLAARIGCRREQVSRELSQLVAEGLLQKNRGGLVLLQSSVLRRRIEDAMKES